MQQEPMTTQQHYGQAPVMAQQQQQQQQQQPQYGTYPASPHAPGRRIHGMHPSPDGAMPMPGMMPMPVAAAPREFYNGGRIENKWECSGECCCACKAFCFGAIQMYLNTQLLPEGLRSQNWLWLLLCFFLTPAGGLTGIIAVFIVHNESVHIAKVLGYPEVDAFQSILCSWFCSCFIIAEHKKHIESGFKGPVGPAVQGMYTAVPGAAMQHGVAEAQC